MFRPHFLFPLFGKLENLKGIGPKSIFNLHKLGILKPLDFLYSFPSSLKIRKHLEIINDFNENETVILKITPICPSAAEATSPCPLAGCRDRCLGGYQQELPVGPPRKTVEK